MIKLFYLMGLSLIASSTVLAQTSFLSPNTNTTPNNEPPNLKGKVISPSDYTTQVNKQSTQNQAAIQQQITQQLSQVPQPSPITTPTVETQPAAPTPSTSAAPLRDVSTPSNTSTGNIFPETKPLAVSPPKPASQPKANYNTSPPTTAPGQIYTGFSKTQPGSGTPAPKAATESPLNIKY